MTEEKPDYSGYSMAQLVGMLNDRDRELKHQRDLMAKVVKENQNLERVMNAYRQWAKKVHESLDVLETIK